MRSVLFSLLLSCLCACASTRRDWRELEVTTVNFQEAWEAFERFARQSGHGPDQQATDRGLRVYQSRWRSRELGFRNTRRTRVRAQFEPLGQDPSKDGTAAAAPTGWRIRFCVERQKVTDPARSMDPYEEDWSWDGQDTDLEQILGGQLRVYFRLPLGAR